MAFAVAGPCSRLRKDGDALSEHSEFAPPPGPANRAGNPKGHATAKFCMVRLEERDRSWVLLPNKGGALRDAIGNRTSYAEAKSGKIQIKPGIFFWLTLIFAHYIFLLRQFF